MNRFLFIIHLFIYFNKLFQCRFIIYEIEIEIETFNF